MNLSILFSRLQLKHCFDFFTWSRNDQLLWVNWQIRCTFHLTYIADHRSTLARWMTQADRRSWTSVIARKSLYLLSFFVVAHICMTFTVSKSHRLAISRHFLPKQKTTKRCFHEVIQTILPRSIAQLSRQCDRIASWYTSDPVFFLQLACGHSRLNPGPIQKKEQDIYLNNLFLASNFVGEKLFQRNESLSDKCVSYRVRFLVLLILFHTPLSTHLRRPENWDAFPRLFLLELFGEKRREKTGDNVNVSNSFLFETNWLFLS